MTADVGAIHRPPLWWILVRHEWRLTYRDIGGKAKKRGPGAKSPKVIGRKRRLFGYLAAAVLLHGAGALTLVLPRTWVDSQGSRIAAIAVLAFLFTLMLSTAMSRVVAAFHERRDLDLLLGAPIPPSLILVVRALTVTVAVTAVFAIFIYPVVDFGVASGRWWMARLYLLVPLMAMLSTAVALAFTGWVVRVIGVRRARVGLQIFSAVVGASFYLVSQARQFLPAGINRQVMAWLMRITDDRDPSLPVVAIARLAAGDALAWIAFVALSIGLFAAAVWSARKRFVQVAQMPEADSPVVAAARPTVERRFASGFSRGLFAALLAKEWRLILRAPQLISQVLLQLLYLTPLMLAAFGREGWGRTWSDAAFAAGIVGITGTLATSLAWLTVSAEDAPDLIAGSPKPESLILWAKLCAAASPPIAIVALAAIGMARRSLTEAAVVLAYGVLACVSAAILEAASPSPGRRSDFQRRHKGRGFWPLVEALQFLLWAAAAGAAASGHALIAAGVTAGALVLPAWRLRRTLARLRPANA